MKKYVIVTDSGSDLTPDMIKKLNVISIPLSVIPEGEREVSDYDIPRSKFYAMMRSGRSAKTSAVNYHTFLCAFRKIAQSGADVLYLGLSSAISSTYSSARTAADRLKREMPERELFTLDTKCASAGLGLLVYLTALKRDEGADVYEALKFAESTAPKICHRFTVDDLSYLRNGGRISAASKFFGNMLGIKPLLYMDSGGFLKCSDRVRGRRSAIESLADTYGRLKGRQERGEIFISHADCLCDARLLDETLYKKYGTHSTKTVDIGAVIGAHAGPGTLALFFLADSR